MLTHGPWAATPDLRHGFLDAADSAPGPWEPTLARLGIPLPIVVPRQVHGTRVVEAAGGTPPEADAVVTAMPGLLVGVVTADCVPVLLVDAARRAGGAVHAGWCGMAAGVLESALDALRERFGIE
ncbi:MAG TPA: polyphenol oxidase family protein, partial [Candidatus Binatia bacterium]|nr:polyphenol oxidase family protein [Candidatus Binatia bacterium]